MSFDPGIFAKELDRLPDWKKEGGGFKRSFEFKSHLDAVKFVEAVSLEAISRDLFPEIRLTCLSSEISFFPEKESSFLKSVEFAEKIDQFCGLYGSA